MPVASLYRANRLWHKGEIAEKGKRKEGKRSIFRPIVGLGQWLMCVKKVTLRLMPKNLLRKQDEEREI